MAKKHYNQTIGFADRLSSSMMHKHINNTQLAEMIGMERKSVSLWVNGYSMPNSLILAKMCKVLDISADYLLFGEKEKNHGS